MATKLVNGIKNMGWMLYFREVSFWLTLHPVQDASNYTLSINTNWVASSSTVLSVESGAGITPVADLYIKCAEFRFLVHCTTMAWDTYMLPLISKVGKLQRATLTLDILLRHYHREESLDDNLLLFEVHIYYSEHWASIPHSRTQWQLSTSLLCLELLSLLHSPSPLELASSTTFYRL